MFIVLAFAQSAFGQQSMNGIRLQDASSHVLTISGPTGGFASNYNFRFPSAVPAAGALLFSSDGIGQNSWLPAGSNGQVLSFTGGLPVWTTLSTLLSGLIEWDLTGNAVTLGYNGLLGNFLGTTNSQPLVLATTNILTPQPIEFFTNNAEKMRLTSAGELGIGLTPTSGKLLHVKGTAGTSNVRFASLASATGTTGRVMFATDATGDLQSLAFPASNGLVLSSTTTGSLSWISGISLAGENYLSLAGQVITANPINLSGSNATGTLAAARFPALTGDVTTVAGTLGTLIANNAVTYGKMQNTSAASVLLGRNSSSAGAIGEITLGAGLAMSSLGVLSASGGSGTVTSVGLTMPSIFTVSNSPVTSSGTLTTSLNTQNANLVFAGPGSGAGTAPTFRYLVAADIPSLGSTDWLLLGNNTSTAYNGTTGNFIGTTNTQPMVIATTNTTTAQPIEFFTNNAERLRIASSGYTGIGLSAPTTILHVASQEDNDAANDIILSTFNNTTSHGGEFVTTRARGTITSPADIQSGDDLGGFKWRGYFNGSYVEVGQIDFVADGAPTASGISNHVAINTSNGSSIIQRIFIDHSGDVAIGTNSPNIRLDVDGAIGARPGTSTITANTTVTVGNRSYLRITHDATAATYTISLSSGSQDGQILIVQCESLDATHQFQFTDGGNLELAGNFVPSSSHSTLSLIWDGAGWAETGRSSN